MGIHSRNTNILFWNALKDGLGGLVFRNRSFIFKRVLEGRWVTGVMILTCLQLFFSHAV